MILRIPIRRSLRNDSAPIGLTSYFRSTNQRARVFAWPQKISIRLKSQSVINTGNDRTPAEAKNSAQYKPKVQYQRQHRVAQIRQRPEGLTTQHQPGVAMNKKGLIVFLASGAWRRPCWWRRLYWQEQSW